MKRAVILSALSIVGLSVNADDFNESYNVISDNYVDEIRDVEIIRPLNGGTVITPEFDRSCPEEMRAAFSYACKIVEEYMPPCLPLRVLVSCGELSPSARGAISKVTSKIYEYFGKVTDYGYTNLSMIKGVIAAELSYNTTNSYADSVPNVRFLTGNPDIKITYNKQRLNEIYFSLDTIPGQKYDFVSLAIRDLFIGLGIYSGFTNTSGSKTLTNPQRAMSPFECCISDALGNRGNLEARFTAATQGELMLKFDAVRNLRLYAPETWTQGVSLNYFIPQEDCAVSKILSYDFGKGMVMRSLNDNYCNTIFSNLLGWRPNFVSGSGPSPSSTGSTSMLMPYNGTISIDGISGYSVASEDDMNVQTVSPITRKITLPTGKEELEDYLNSFHPFLTDGSGADHGISVCLLKKDGTWDLVKFSPDYFPGMTITYSLSDWTLHYDDAEYARTLDGYLRARITVQYRSSGRTMVKSKFFVVDYLPQRVGLSYAYKKDIEVSAGSVEKSTNTDSEDVRLYFYDTEGVDHIVIECLREGFRVPGKILITNVKKGYYDTTINRNTTFTAVSYNDNGAVKGLPVTVTLRSGVTKTSLDFKLQGDEIAITSDGGGIGEMDYSIAPLSAAGTQSVHSGVTAGTIDISALPAGLYVLTVNDVKTAQSETFKFKK